MHEEWSPSLKQIKTTYMWNCSVVWSKSKTQKSCDGYEEEAGDVCDFKECGYTIVNGVVTELSPVKKSKKDESRKYLHILVNLASHFFSVSADSLSSIHSS